MNKEVAEVEARLARVFAKSSLKWRLLGVVVRNEEIRGLIKEYLDGELEDSAEGWGFLKEVVKDRLELAEEAVAATADRSTGQTLPKEEPPPEEAPYRGSKIHDTVLDVLLYQDSFVGPKSEAMLRATSEFFRWKAGQHPGVARFRSRMLSGSILSASDAQKLIGSYAARLFPFEWFLDWGIPIVGHTSRIVDGYDWGTHRGALDHRVTVRVDPPGITERVRYAHPGTRVADEDEALLSTRCVLTRSGAAVPPYDAMLPEEAQPPDDLVEVKRSPTSDRQDGIEESSVYLAPLALSDSIQTPSRPFSVWPGSVIDGLFDLARELAASYPWVEKEAAAEFVLTDAVPRANSLYAKLYLNGDGTPNGQLRISLDVLPWVPPEDVLLAYKRVQRRVVEGRNKLPGGKTCEVVCFVWEQDRLNGYKRPPWSVLCARWNATYRDMTFQKWRSFRASFERGEAAVKELIGDP